MNDNVFYISGLLQKQMNQVLSAYEQEVLNAWLSKSEDNVNLYKQLQDETFVKAELEKFEKYDEEKNREYLRGEVEKRRKVNGEWSMVNEEENKQSATGNEQRKAKVIQLWKRIAVAASIIGVLFVGYWLINPSTSLRTENPSTVAQDVNAPDKNRAQIKLADGSVVYLDSAANGELVDVNGVKVLKTADGKVEYNGQLTTGNHQLVYNTLMNPRGSIVMNMTLSDGSRVWLNAGSSITYPVAFIGTERNVTVSGEAYFEISHDANKPFKVGKGDVSVTVLGTHFNVNAYDDNSEIKVTLLEGSVRVQSGADSRESVVIKPGEQARAIGNNPSTSLRVDKDVDVEKVMAWKNNEFIFEDDKIEEIMQQLSYWYDIDVEYSGVSSTNYSGRISRTASISKVLKMFERLGYVKFEINDKNIRVVNIK